MQSEGKTWTFDEWSIGYGSYTFDGHEINTVSSSAEGVRLHLGLMGDYKFYFKPLDATFDLIGGHHNLMYSREFGMTLENKSLAIETFGVKFTLSRFLSLIAGMEDPWAAFIEQARRGENTILSKRWGAVNVSIQQVVNQIKQNPYQGSLQHVFLQSKAMELLVLCTTALNRQQLLKSVLKNSADKAKIIAARDFIHSRLHQPPSLKDIAQEVGLNEYKLKYGFREIFQHSVISYLTALRLDHARHLLLNTSQSAAEISIEMGYATPQHFNNAFKKQFGTSPQMIRKNTDSAI